MKHIDQLCVLCGGSGRTTSLMASTRGRKGGNRAVVNSRKPGGRPMSKRNQGGPRRVTSDDLVDESMEKEEDSYDAAASTGST